MFESKICDAEVKLRDIILQFTTPLFNAQWMPSHDLEHHERVWNNAKELCDAFEKKRFDSDPFFFEKLIIACYFHDTGLLRDKGELHGRISREICESFLKQISHKIKFDTKLTLDAIEFHDQKEYGKNQKAQDNSVYLLLSLADDIDSFGAIGTYRYIEIYLQRGMNPESIPLKVLKNAAGRYKNLCSVLTLNGIDAGRYAQKYNVLKTLLHDDEETDSVNPLILWITKNVVHPRENPSTFFNRLTPDDMDIPLIQDFVEGYLKENGSVP